MSNKLFATRITVVCLVRRAHGMCSSTVWRMRITRSQIVGEQLFTPHHTRGAHKTTTMIADTKCTVYPALILLALVYTPLGFQTCENSYVRYLAMRSTISPLRPSLAMSTRTDDATRLQTRDDLMQKISDTPRNSPTPKTTTSEILSLVQRLESMCPTEDENVLESSSGGWELLWTAQVGRWGYATKFVSHLVLTNHFNLFQDQTSPEFDQNPFQTWIK